MNILIVGAGEVGSSLTRVLSRQHDITLIDRDEDRVAWAAEQLDARIVHGSGSSFRTLEKANVRDADVMAAMTENEEANLLICKMARRAGVGLTIARVRNQEYLDDEFILSNQDLGVDHMLHPEKETAQSIMHLLRQCIATDVLEFADGLVELIGIRLEPGSPVVHKTLSEINQMHADLCMRVVAVKRGQHTVIPGGDDVLMPRDQIFVICANGSLSQVLAMTGKEDQKIENVMILGGGMTGQFVAEGLANDANVKIVEMNQKKTEELANKLKHALVIHGNGTDIDLLTLEGLTDMDALVSVTASDETNIIASLVARHLEVPRTISLVNNVNYLPFGPTIGLDAVVSKQIVAANAVRHLIRQRETVSMMNVPGLDAVINEYIVGEKASITKNPLHKIKFPAHAMIGAILRGTDVLVPSGDIHVQPDDKVYVFALPDAVSATKKLFG